MPIFSRDIGGLKPRPSPCWCSTKVSSWSLSLFWSRAWFATKASTKEVTSLQQRQCSPPLAPVTLMPSLLQSFPRRRGLLVLRIWTLLPLVDDLSPSHQNSNGGSYQDFLLWLGCLDYDLDCLDFELDFIYGIYKSYKYEHTNLLAPLTMLSFNHQNHNHGQMRSFSFPRDKCGHGMLLPSNTDIKITRICVLDFCRHDSYKVENYIGWLHCQGICYTTYKVAASLLI